MTVRLELLIEEKRELEAKLVQVQSMLRTIEDYIAQERAKEGEGAGDTVDAN